MNALNKQFNLNLSRKQIKNQKNVIQTLFFDYKFLGSQSGFGWDDNKKKFPADLRAWSELIEAHPRRNFGKLKDKPFALYKLAEKVFTRNFCNWGTSQ